MSENPLFGLYVQKFREAEESMMCRLHEDLFPPLSPEEMARAREWDRRQKLWYVRLGNWWRMWWRRGQMAFAALRGEEVYSDEWE